MPARLIQCRRRLRKSQVGPLEKQTVGEPELLKAILGFRGSTLSLALRQLVFSQPNWWRR